MKKLLAGLSAVLFSILATGQSPTKFEELAAEQEYWDEQIAMFGEESLLENEGSPYNKFLSAKEFYESRLFPHEILK